MLLDHPSDFIDLGNDRLHIGIFFTLQSLHYKRYRVPDALVTFHPLLLRNHALAGVLLQELFLQTHDLFLLLTVDLAKHCHLLLSLG